MSYTEALAGHQALHNGILRGLPATTRVYPYKGRQDFLDIIHSDEHTIEFAVFVGIKEDLFNGVFHDFSLDFYRFVKAYDSTNSTLLVKMPARVHAQAGMGFRQIIFDSLSSRNRKSLVDFGTVDLNINNRTRKPDQGLGPLNRPTVHDQDWPSLVIEVAFSESRTKLDSDARLWLTGTHNQVNTVITIAITKTRLQTITISKWTLSPNDGQPHCAHQVIIQKTSAQDKTPNVRNAPLGIGFDEIFCRSPQSPETDIILDAVTLGEFATTVWMRSS